MKWSFRSASEQAVVCPIALDGGVRRVIGKRHDAATDTDVPSEPSVYELTPRQAAQLRAYFAKAITQGHIAPADADTAKHFNVNFDASAASPAGASAASSES